MEEIGNPKIFPCAWRCPGFLVRMSGHPWKHRTPQWDENSKVTWSCDGSWQVINWHLETLPCEMPVHCQSAVIIRKFMPAGTWLSPFVSYPLGHGSALQDDRENNLNPLHMWGQGHGAAPSRSPVCMWYDCKSSTPSAHKCSLSWGEVIYQNLANL